MHCSAHRINYQNFNGGFFPLVFFVFLMGLTSGNIISLMLYVTHFVTHTYAIFLTLIFILGQQNCVAIIIFLWSIVFLTWTDTVGSSDFSFFFLGKKKAYFPSTVLFVNFFSDIIKYYHISNCVQFKWFHT